MQVGDHQIKELDHSKIKGYKEKNPLSQFQALLSFKIRRRARATQGSLIGENTHANSKATNLPSVKGWSFGFHPFKGQGKLPYEKVRVSSITSGCDKESPGPRCKIITLEHIF